MRIKSSSLLNIRYGVLRRISLLSSTVIIFSIIGYLLYFTQSKIDSIATYEDGFIEAYIFNAKVKHLEFMNALEKANAGVVLNYNDIRRTHEQFHTSIKKVLEDECYNFLSANVATQIKVQSLESYLTWMSSLITLDNEDFRVQLPRITQEARIISNDMFLLTKASETHFENIHEATETDVKESFWNIFLLTSILLLIVLVFTFILARLTRINRERFISNKYANGRMKAILSSSLDAILAINPSGKIIEFNGAAAQLFGYSQEEAIGSHMADLIVPDHLREAHEQAMQRYLETREKRVVGKGRVRLEGKHKNGKVFPIEISISSAIGAEDEIFVSYIRDISKELEYENELRKARDAAIAGEKSKSKLLAVMNHEMRTPLNGILGTMELLNDTDLSTQQKRYLRIMGKSGNLLLSHVNDVLDISRLEAGIMEINTSIFDLNTLITDLIESQSTIAKKKNITLNFLPAVSGQMLVSSDPMRVRQILMNLLGNALKFTQSGSISVELEVLQDGRSIEMRVIDTGIGINEQDIDNIFDDFTTLDSSFGRRAEGTGLGLGIARRIVNTMNGEMGVESEEGEGSMFWVRLPIFMEEDYTIIEQNSAAAKSGHKKQQETQTQTFDILIIEDNEINRLVARDFLEADNHRISEAHNGSEGVKMAHKTKFDLILMDISMPEMDGVEATHAIRSGDGVSRMTPIFALTAHASEEDEARFIKAGMERVIVKPVTKKSLQNAMRALGRQRTQHKKTERDANATSGLVDLQNILEFRNDLSEEKFQSIFEKFITEMDADTEEMLQASHAELTGDALAKQAHRLAGSAASFGAFKLRQKLNTIEVKAKANPNMNFAPLVQEMHETWLATRQILYKLF